MTFRKCPVSEILGFKVEMTVHEKPLFSKLCYTSEGSFDMYQIILEWSACLKIYMHLIYLYISVYDNDINNNI